MDATRFIASFCFFPSPKELPLGFSVRLSMHADEKAIRTFMKRITTNIGSTQPSVYLLALKLGQALGNI